MKNPQLPARTMIVKLTIQVLRRSRLNRGFINSVVAQKFELWRTQAEPYCFPVCYNVSETSVKEIAGEHEPYLEGFFGNGNWEFSTITTSTGAFGLERHEQHAFFVIN